MAITRVNNRPQLRNETMNRREFFTSSLAATALAGAGCASLRDDDSDDERSESKRGKQEYYELRAYRLKNSAQEGNLDSYLEKAAIPAWNGMGIKPVGVFAEKEPKEAPTVFVLLAAPSAEKLVSASLHLPQSVGPAAAYLETPKDKPPFERVDSWLMLAFAGLPKIELPAYSKQRKPRLFEMRTYESYNELKALKKVAMFNDGEIDTMREVGLAPIFFGQALTGPNLPHLTYMTSAESEELHKQHWDAFGKHPKWNEMKNDPQYANTVSKITKWFLVPKPYSQI